jgi:AsmA protein
MKLVKRLFQILALLLVIAVIAVGVFVATFDANAYKPEIVQAVKEHTGRDLAIEGDIGLSIFPTLGLELGSVRLGNAPGFGDQPFAASKNVIVKVAVLPLLRKELQVSKVVLRGLRLDLQRRADGTTNWDDLVQPSAPPEAPPEKAPPPEEVPSEPEAPPIAAIAIGGVEITDARVSWRDEQAGQALVIAPLNLTTGELAPGKDFPLGMDVTVKGEQPAVDLRLELTGQANLDPDAQRYRLKDLLLQLVADGADLPVEKADLRMRANLDADMQAQRIAFSALDLTLKTTGGPVTRSEIGLTGGVTGDLARQQYTGDAVELAVTAEGQDLPGGKAELELSAKQARADLNAQSAALQGLNLVAYKVVNAAGELTATGIISQPRAKGSLSVEPFSPRELFKAMAIEPPVTADDKVLRKAAADLVFDGGTDSVALSDIQLVLDDTSIKGGATLSEPAKPKVAFKLAVDAIDADRYLPPPTEGESKPAPVPAGGGTGDDSLPIPVEELRSLELDGQLTVGKLKVSNLRMQDVDLTVTANDGLVQVRPLTLAMYDGRLHATSTIDVRGETPKYHFTPKLEGLQVGPLLKDYMGEDKLSGTTTASLDLSSAGSTVSAIKSALDGSVALAFKNGSIKGFNLRNLIETAEAKLKGKKAPEPLTRETDFSAITVSGAMKNGRLTSTDLDGLAPFLRIGGDGWVDLAKETLDYTAKIKIVGSEEGQGGKTLDDLKGLTIPVALKGSLTDPKYDIKLGDALKDAAVAKQKEKLEEEKAKLEAQKAKLKAEQEAKLEAEKQKQKDEVDEKIEKERDKLKDKLKKLF